MPIVASRGVDYTMQTVTTTGNGTPVTAPIQAFYHNFTLLGVGTIGAGVVSIEEANSETYAGTWSVLTTVQCTLITGTACLVVHTVGRFRCLRSRFSSNVTGGGNVSVLYNAY